MREDGESWTLGPAETGDVGMASVTRRMDTFCSGFWVGVTCVDSPGVTLGAVEFSGGIAAVK